MARRQQRGPLTWLCIAITIPTLPLWLPIVCAVRCYKANRPQPTPEEVNERIFVKQHRKPPRPLPLRRKFNLSDESLLVSDPNSSPLSLLRLPYTVRRQIYHHLFANLYVIHVHQLPYRLGESHSPYHSWWLPDQHTRSTMDYHLMRNYTFAKPGHTEPALDLAVLRTCRQLYQEAIPLLYSTNTFDFDSIPPLLYLAQTIRPQRLESIRYLQLSFNLFMVGAFAPEPRTDYPFDMGTWQRVWKMVRTRMKGLRDLEVTLLVHAGDYGDEKRWLEPISALRGLQKFALRMEHLRAWAMEEAGGHILAYRREIHRLVRLPREQLEISKIKGVGFDESSEWAEIFEGGGVANG